MVAAWSFSGIKIGRKIGNLKYHHHFLPFICTLHKAVKDFVYLETITHHSHRYQLHTVLCAVSTSLCAITAFCPSQHRAVSSSKFIFVLKLLERSTERSNVKQVYTFPAPQCLTKCRVEAPF